MDRATYVQGGKGCFSDTAKRQELPAADSFLFWNADDVTPIRDRLDGFVCVFQILAAPRRATGSC